MTGESPQNCERTLCEAGKWDAWVVVEPPGCREVPAWSLCHGEHHAGSESSLWRFEWEQPA